MRRVAAGALLALVLAVPAQASFHRETVNEVLANGSAGRQFVELLDPAGELFPSSSEPYKLKVFTETGADVGEQELAAADLTNTTQPVVFANAAQGGGHLLTVALPKLAGQVCFTSGMFNTVVNCLIYRCPEAKSVPLDKSVQPGGGGGLTFATPTPGAANVAGQSAHCPIVAGGAGDTRKPKVSLSGSKRQRLSKLSITLKPDEAGAVTVSGYAKVGSKKLAFKTRRGNAQAGQKLTLRLKFLKARANKIKAAQAAGRNVTVALKVTVKDAAGNAGTAKRSIKLRR